jgi:multidrug resistance efflux pump
MWRKAILLPTVLCSFLASSGDAPIRAVDSVETPIQDDGAPAARDRITAILAPRRRAVLSAEVPGRVISLNKELGSAFDGGETLICIDDATYKVNARVAEAKLDAAEKDHARVRRLSDEQTRRRHANAVLAAAQANLVATQRLYDNNHASQVDLENAKRDVTVAETELELVESTATGELIRVIRDLAAAKGRSELARQKLADCRIRGPWSGRVARVHVNEHELVDRGTPLIEVIDDSVLLAKALLPSAVFQSVSVGQELRLVVRETGETASAKVSHIAAALDAASVTFEVWAEVMNGDGRLRAGMNGTFSLAEIKGH